MPSDQSAPQPLNQPTNKDLAVPDAVIEDFLGLGLAYSEWPAEVRKRNYVWYPALKNIIIKKQWEYFKPEIQVLRLEPRIGQPSRSKSNSLESILMRLKGEPWAEGRPDEREERLRTHRLLGKDAKIRCLQKYVRDWDEEAALLASQCSVENVADKSAPERITNRSTASACTASGTAFCFCPSEARDFCDNPESESGRSPGNADITTHTLHPIYGSSPHHSYSNTHHFTDLGVATGDFDRLPVFQNALPHSHAQTSVYYPEFDIPEVHTQPTPAFSHDIAMASFDQLQIGEDHVPHSPSYSQMLDLPKAEPNCLTRMETNPVSEGNLEFLDNTTHHSGPAFQGTFFDPGDTIDVCEYLHFKDIPALESGLTQETKSRDCVGQSSSQQGCAEDLFPSVSLPQHSSHGRKRRRQDTSRVSSGMSGYTNATGEPSPNSTPSNGDILMVGYESSSHHQNSLVSQEQRTQLAPAGTTPISPPAPNSGMTSKVACTSNFTQIRLEVELQRMIGESQSATKRHQQELDSLRRRYHAEISTLQKQVRELQLSNEYYEGLAREFLSQNVILQEASSNKKSISDLPPIRSKERENSAKPGHSFPSSKNPRPLSLSLRPATAGNSSSSSRKASAATLQDISTPKPPVSTSCSNRPSSADRITLKGAAVDNDTSVARSRIPVTSESHAPAFCPSKSAGRGTRSAPTDSVATLDVNFAAKRDPNPIQQSMHKFGNWFLRKPCREDSRPIEIVPTLPPFAASVPLHRDISGVLIDGDKRRTKDSGYASLQSET